MMDEADGVGGDLGPEERQREGHAELFGSQNTADYTGRASLSLDRGPWKRADGLGRLGALDENGEVGIAEDVNDEEDLAIGYRQAGPSNGGTGDHGTNWWQEEDDELIGMNELPYIRSRKRSYPRNSLSGRLRDSVGSLGFPFATHDETSDLNLPLTAAAADFGQSRVKGRSYSTEKSASRKDDLSQLDDRDDFDETFLPLQGRKARRKPMKEILRSLPPWLGGRRRPIKGPRIIFLNDTLTNASLRYATNSISTAKYNVVTFLPKFLFVQFSKYANVFFLFTAAIQQIPDVSPINRYTTIIPFSLVMLASAFAELEDDFGRHRSDRLTNNAKTTVLVSALGSKPEFVTKRWRELVVGDVVRLQSGDHLPADLALLSSSEPEGLAYIETANLDGETNLKIKQANVKTAPLVTPDSISRLKGRVRSEQPNNSLYTFEATLEIEGQPETALEPNQLLLRGAQLKNTGWIYGLVIFTGHETKLMRNATSAPIKQTNVERNVNKMIIFLFVVLLVLAIVSTIGSAFWTAYETGAATYLRLDALSQSLGGKIRDFIKNILTFLILYNALIPISLMVTIELVKLQLANYINWDLDMYYDKSDTPAECRTSSLVEELGQVEHIFSDKTGTLTRNVMEFKQCSIAGKMYAEHVPNENSGARLAAQGLEGGQWTFQDMIDHHRSEDYPHRDIVSEFCALLAICHTVIPEVKEGAMAYQASSPDEGALVAGAVQLGYQFVARKPQSLFIKVDGGEQMEFQLLNVCEFNSTRKRMSTIVRAPDGRIKLYCKGADTVILERLAQDDRARAFVDTTMSHLEEYATEGLRTLCLAMREVSEEEYQRWQVIHQQAANTINGREEALEKAAELIEKDLVLLGATAIEDKLQEGVPETIAQLQEAGIKVWVLTGDRQETAIQIGLSCRLIAEGDNLLVCNTVSKAETASFLSRKLMACQEEARSIVAKDSITNSLAFVIDGQSLGFALEKDLALDFLALASFCKSVVCCRVSPLQKALVVKLVKGKLNRITLAIGDGANDVGMIQAAHIGVGISGMEGLQAARSADVAIGQFRYLKKLLLIHGAWSYQRLSKLILYSFYKNATAMLIQFYFAWYNGFSGQSIFESWTLSAYNAVFTALVPVAIGLFDQSVSARMLDRYPQLYHLGQQNTAFNLIVFVKWMANAVYHSLILFFVSGMIWGDDAFWTTRPFGSVSLSTFYRGDLILFNGLSPDLWTWGTGLYLCVLLTVVGKAMLITDLWTLWCFVAIPGSFLFTMAFIPIYSLLQSLPPIRISPELQNIVRVLYPAAAFWLSLMLLSTFCLLRDFAWKCYMTTFHPSSVQIVLEIQRLGLPDNRPRGEHFQKALKKVRAIQRMRRNRGFAFSQNEQGQEALVRMYDTGVSKPKG